MSYRSSLAAKTVKLVRTGHSRSSWINSLAFVFTCRAVWYMPWRYVSTHNHTTMDNRRMSWRCVENGAKQDIGTTRLFFLWGAGAFVCVPRLPLLPMLGSLTSAIQLYSGGMETGLRSPGTTNQQSEYWLRGGVAGRWWLRDSVGDNQESGRVRGVCRRGVAVPSKAFSVSIYQSLICEYCCCYVTVVYCC